MYPNQLSARGLFSSNLGRSETSLISDRDFSQLKGSQYELTQYSQDCYSQSQCSGGSQSESQGQKIPMYEKYMSKPSLFRTNSQNRIQSSKTSSSSSSSGQQDPGHLTRTSSQGSFQQQIALNKVKAKERDERDLLSSIVDIVQECSKEVKQNLVSMKEHSTSSEQSLNSSMKSLIEAMETSTAKILTVVQGQEEHRNKEERLQRDIIERDATIQQLQRQMYEIKAAENPSILLDSLKSFLMEQQSQLEQKFKKVLDATSEELKLIKDQANIHRSMSEENSKHFQDIKYTNQRHVQDVEKRILDELIVLRDDFDRQKRDTESFYRSQLQIIHQKQSRDFEKQLQRGMESSTRASLEQATDFYQQNCLDLKELCKSQQDHLKDYIEHHSAEQAKQYFKMQENLYKKYQHDMQKDLQSTHDMIKTAVDKVEQLQDNNKVGKEMSWKNSHIPQNIQDQLDELHNSHQAEIKRLQKEVEQQRQQKSRKEKIPNSNEGVESENDASIAQNLHNVYQLSKPQASTEPCTVSGQTNTAEPLFQRRIGFVSPKPPHGTSWNSRTLFGRANPSPIATVRPQRQKNVCTGIAMSEKNELPRADTVFQHTPHAPQLTAHISPVANERRQYPIRSRNINSSKADEAPYYSLPSEDTTEPQTEQKISDKMSLKVNGAGRKRKKRRKRKPFNPTKKSKLCVPHKELSTPSRFCETVGNTAPKAGTVTGQLCSNTREMFVYDFIDEFSPPPIQKKLRNKAVVSTTVAPVQQKGVEKKWLALSPGSSCDSSQNSSPTMSLTDVFIKRKVISGRKTPDVRNPESMTIQSNPFTEVSEDCLLGDITGPPHKEISDNIQDMMNFSHQKRQSSASRQSHMLTDIDDVDTEILQIRQSVMQCVKRKGKSAV